MGELNHSMKVNIELQGKETLEYLENNDSVPTYKVIGFDQDLILLRDHRKLARIAIETYLQNHNADRFLSYFCSPVKIKLNSNPGKYIIDIYDDVSLEPAHYSLWIAIGMGKDLPAYEYVFYYAVPMEDDTFAMISIYLHPEAQDLDSSLHHSKLAATHVETA